ncbi:MAG: GGDEF domain-containing protein [bacterium]
MVKIKDIMVRDVLTAQKDEALFSLIEKMHQHRIGAIVIVNSTQNPIGIITERDIIKTLITYKENIFSKKAADIMVSPLVTLLPDEDIETATMLMSLNRIRRIPVVKDDKLEGIVTYRDIVHAFRKGYHNLAEKTKILTEDADKDALTGLYTKKYIFAELAKQLKKSVHTRQAFAVLMLDVDFFKKINDTYGHLAGDEVLKSLAEILTSRSRTVNTIGRYGGDEFTIISPLASHKSSYFFAERLREAIEKRDFIYEESILKFTISIGICIWNPKIKTAREMIKLADQALYTAKHNGRNQFKMSGSEDIKF